MHLLKPKAQHEQLQADADHALILEHMKEGREQDINNIAATLAYQCDLFVHFHRLWQLRVSDLDEKLNSEEYAKKIYANRKTMYKELRKEAASRAT